MVKQHYFEVILEDIYGKLQLIAETLAPLGPAVDRLQHDMTDVKSEITVIKALIMSHSKQLDRHEQLLSTP